jgi:hypothetical protein
MVNDKGGHGLCLPAPLPEAEVRVEETPRMKAIYDGAEAYINSTVVHRNGMCIYRLLHVSRSDLPAFAANFYKSSGTSPNTIKEHRLPHHLPQISEKMVHWKAAASMNPRVAVDVFDVFSIRQAHSS